MESGKIYGFVYLVGNLEYGFFKIGAALEPEKRIPSLQTGCPFDLTTFALKHHRNYYDFEKRLHRRYVKNWVRGEWFKFSLEELNEVQQYINDGGRNDTRTESTQPRSEPVLPVPADVPPSGLPEISRAGDNELQTGRGPETVDLAEHIRSLSPRERATTVPRRIPVNSEQYKMYMEEK